MHAHTIEVYLTVSQTDNQSKPSWSQSHGLMFHVNVTALLLVL